MQKFKIQILIIILVLAAFLRLWDLVSMPPGFSADEATIGYNAYSVFKTGRDEYGNFLPLAFKSFSDYQAPLYTYITIPFIAVFGLSEFAVRLPSALAGIGTVFIIFLLVQKLFSDYRLSALSALFLAISPWHIFFSRGAWQSNLATFCMAFGVYLFIISKDRPKILPLSVLAFLASLYAYQSQRLIVPILGILIFSFYWKELFKQKRALIFSSVLGFILIIPIFFIIISPSGQARFKGVSIFTDLGPINRINEYRGGHSNPNGSVANILHNKGQEYLFILAKNYLEHYSPKFLFTNGDPIGRQNIPEAGVMNLIDAILLPLGFIYLLNKKRIIKGKILILWLIIAPIASAVTFQSPNALRAANMAVPLTIVSAFGAFMIYEFINKQNKYLKYPTFIALILVISYFVIMMLHQYFIHLPTRYALEWEYGFGKMIKIVDKEQLNYSKVVITNRYDQPYILTLFYLRYNPKQYQKIGKKETEIDKFGFTTISSFDKYEFKKISQQDLEKSKNTIFVTTSEEISDDIPADDIIYFPNGKPAFNIYKT